MRKSNLDTKVAGALLADPETTATAILVIALSLYGEAVMGDEEQGLDAMDPIELWLSLEKDLDTKVHDNNENRLNALLTALTTNYFYEEKSVFMSVCASLDDGDLGDPIDLSLDDLTLPEILWAIYEVELARDDDPDFSPGIKRFIDDAIEKEASEEVNYLDEYIADRKAQLFQELASLGVDASHIKALSVEEALA